MYGTHFKLSLLDKQVGLVPSTTHSEMCFVPRGFAHSERTVRQAHIWDPHMYNSGSSWLDRTFRRPIVVAPTFMDSARFVCITKYRLRQCTSVLSRDGTHQAFWGLCVTRADLHTCTHTLETNSKFLVKSTRGKNVCGQRITAYCIPNLTLLCLWCHFDISSWQHPCYEALLHEKTYART